MYFKSFPDVTSIKSIDKSAPVIHATNLKRPAEKTPIIDITVPEEASKPRGFADFASSQDTYEPAAKKSKASMATSGLYMPPPPPSIGPIDVMTPSQPHSTEPREGQPQESTGILSNKDPLELLSHYHKAGKAVGPNSWIFEGKGSFFKVYVSVKAIVDE